jgi:hypothetical protein
MRVKSWYDINSLLLRGFYSVKLRYKKTDLSDDYINEIYPIIGTHL